MKLRIRDNSLRLRLSRSEVKKLSADGSVRARIRFPGGSELTYEVEGSPACVAPTAAMEAERISVRLPASVIDTWATTDQVSISDVQKLSTGESLTILVEKDFACLSPREGEDDSDMFEHPDAGKANCCSGPMKRQSSPFTAATLRFLEELDANNNRPWFQDNKDRYESEVLDPALEFIDMMYEPLAKIAPRFTAIAKRSGGSLMRVYRDTRFARDKTPYKTNIGIQFRHELGRDVHAPGYYVHIAPDRSFVGAGLWRPPSAPLRQIRQRIADKPSEWRRVTGDERFSRQYALSGESLVRAPRGFAADHALIDDLRRKDFIAVRDLVPGEVTSPGFPEKVQDAMRAAEPLMRFLCRATGVPF